MSDHDWTMPHDVRYWPAVECPPNCPAVASSFTPPRLRGDEPPPHGLKWIAVDFDNTLCQTNYDLQTGENPMGPAIPGTLEKCLELVANGYKIVIHTSRPWYDYEAIEAWLRYHHYPFHSIVCGKLQARGYVDDRNIDHRAESWLPV